VPVHLTYPFVPSVTLLCPTPSQLLCHHYRVYYPVRQHLVQHMVSSIQRLGLTPNATIEQRKLAVDLAEV